MTPRSALVLKIAVPLILFLFLATRTFFYAFVASPRVLQSTTPWVKWLLFTEVVFAAVAWVVYRPKAREDFGQLVFWTLVLAAQASDVAFEWVNCLGDSSPATIVDVEFVPRSGRPIVFRVVSGPQTGLEFECDRVTWGPVGVAKHRLQLRRGRLGVWWGKLLPLTS
jgi:hypothetical protein